MEARDRGEDLNVSDYNYERFSARHLLRESRRALVPLRLPAGVEAPDFELDCVQGRTIRLRDMRGHPVLLRFVSYTCPIAVGSAEPMKRLHAMLGHEVQFLDVHVRQAHPGSNAPAYRTMEQKTQDARAFQALHAIPWPVVVDDLRGTVHQRYGSLMNATYIIDSDGRVAFFGAWSGAPALHRALTELMERGGKGTVLGGAQLRPHPLPALVAGWPAIARGGKGSASALMKSVPGLPLLMWAGHQARPLLAPLALRARPTPRWLRLTAGAALAGAASLWLLRRR